MDSKERKKAIRKVLKREVKDGKVRVKMSKDIEKLFENTINSDSYTLDELQLMYSDFVETEVEACEKWRYDDCVDNFIKFMKTGRINPTLEELNV